MGRFAPHLCADAVTLLLLWMPLGRPLAPWITGLAVALLVAGLLLNRITDAVRLRHMPLLLAFALASIVSASFSPYRDASLGRGASGFF